MTDQPRGVDATELVAIESVTKRFGAVRALDDVSLTIRDNEFFAMLGPSGGGKTTLLRLLAGFEFPDSGRILLEGRDIAALPPYRRPFNMMFQSYALFPHMNVADNVAYGLRQDGVERGERDRRVGEALDLVRLKGLDQRRPHQLSGGQRQRVALARALVKRPKLLLLDEPLAALDRKLRAQMQLELKQLQADVGITFVHVTHDQEEALVMADRAAIIDHGRVLQVGTPSELYEWPTSEFVAGFLGESNMWRGQLVAQGSGLALDVGGRRMPIGAEPARRADLGVGHHASLIVRPERIRVGADTGHGERGVVREVAYLGPTRRFVVVMPDGHEAVGRMQVGRAGPEIAAGDMVTVDWDPEFAALVPALVPAD